MRSEPIDRTSEDWCAVLAAGEMQILGMLPGASNYTLLAKLIADGADSETLVVYKPRRGETPLWDFPIGTLCRREVAAYLVSEVCGWGFVPPTIMRDGPAGEGAVQLFVEHDPSITAFDLAETCADELMKIVAFDAAINNADRKAGHVLLDTQGGLWGIDHGICFHEEPKLRTVLWDYCGLPIPPAGIACLEGLSAGLAGDLGRRLRDLLSPAEVEALAARTRGLLAHPTFPQPGPHRSFPWPPV